MAVAKTFECDRGDFDFCIGVNDPNKSNEQITLAATTVALPAGAILTKVTATGHYKPYNPAGADGTEIVTTAVILGGYRGISTGTQKAVGVVRDQPVNSKLLRWIVAATAPQKASVLAAMLVSSIVAR